MSDKPVPTLLVCTHRRLGAGSCGGSGSESLRDTLLVEVAARGLGWRVETVGCLGHCANGPNLKAVPGGPLVHASQTEPVDELVGRLLAEWKVRS